MQTVVSGATGTTGMTSVTAIFENLSGQFWDGSAWVTFNNSNLASYKTAATERGTLAQYAAAIPAGAREEWVTAYFLDSSNQTVAWASNSIVTNTSAAVRSALSASDVSGWWPVWLSDDSAEPGVLTKATGDFRVFGFDFGNLEEIVSGQSITALTLTSTGSVTLTNKTYSTYAAFAEFDDGTVGDQTVTATITLSGGSQVVRTGTLRIV